LLNFTTIMGANLAYEALDKLGAPGQNVTEIWVDSAAIAGLFAAAVFITRLSHEE
jgi:hypothetical protein